MKVHLYGGMLRLKFYLGLNLGSTRHVSCCDVLIKEGTYPMKF